jgi:hypothetical protein
MKTFQRLFYIALGIATFSIWTAIILQWGMGLAEAWRPFVAAHEKISQK